MVTCSYKLGIGAFVAVELLMFSKLAFASGERVDYISVQLTSTSTHRPASLSTAFSIEDAQSSLLASS